MSRYDELLAMGGKPQAMIEFADIELRALTTDLRDPAGTDIGRLSLVVGALITACAKLSERIEKLEEAS